MLAYEEIRIEAGFLDRVWPVHSFVAVDGDNDRGRGAECATDGIAEGDIKVLGALTETIVDDERGDRFR